MSKKLKLVGFLLLSLGVVLLVAGYLHGHSIAVLNPQGFIANKERGLIVTITLLMLIVVIPVFALTFAIAWKYREGNTAARYSPEWDHNRWVEAVWWAVPLVLITVISMISWSSSHELDPFRPLRSANPPITIQVVALQWKWLFIYPDQNIATVNFVQFPANTPVDFQITSDAPMNSFWIPQLGGQIYAMAGMSTQLHLMEELKKIKRVIGKGMDTAPHEILLIIDGNTGQNALAQVKAFDDALGLTGLVVTKLDGTAKGGVLAAIARTRPVPVYFIGIGEQIEDLQPFNAEEFVDALLGIAGQS